MDTKAIAGLSDACVHDSMKVMIKLLNPSEQDGYQISTANRIYRSVQRKNSWDGGEGRDKGKVDGKCKGI